MVAPGGPGSQDMFVARYHSRGVVSKLYIPVNHRENYNVVSSRLGVKLLNRLGLRCPKLDRSPFTHRSYWCTGTTHH